MGGPRLLLPALAVLALGLGACTSSEEEEPADGAAAPAEAAQVALEGGGVPQDLVIGVVVSLTSPSDPGPQWLGAAEGAEVAAYRLERGGASVDVVAVDDKGSARGAARAVQQLADQGASGVVLATSGGHVAGAFDAARVASMPVLVPYAPSPDFGDGGAAWLTGPDQPSVTAALVAGLDDAGLSAPLVLDAGGPGLSDLPSAQRLSAGQGPGVARRAAELLGDGTVDSVVVSGSAERQAQVVAALQGAGVDAPLLLTPDALSPVLAREVVEADGSLSLDAVTAGVAAGDVTALGAGEPGQALSAFFAGVRAAAGDPDVQDFFGDQPFSAVAADADVRSHDAVVALARAAEAAGSTEPAEVAQALSEMTLTREDGLAGPSLDFGDRSAVAAEDVVPLQATTQDPGMRSTGDGAEGTEAEPRLFWFPVPGA